MTIARTRTRTRTRRTLTGLLASMALSLIAMTGLSGAAQASEVVVAPPSDVAVDSSSHGCPTGAVCIYPDASWNGGNPTYVFYSYGVHRIYDQYGHHRVYNNQYGSAYVSLCGGSNGTNCDPGLVPGAYIDEDLDPFNSVELYT